MNENFIVIDATDDIVIGGFGNLEGNLSLLKYSYEEISQKMKENNNKEDDIRLVNSLLDSIRELQQENQELKKQLEEKENQQKEFMKLLENKIDTLTQGKETFADLDKGEAVVLMELAMVLEEYKEIIGDKE